jgi:hypothetical protein
MPTSMPTSTSMPTPPPAWRPTPVSPRLPAPGPDSVTRYLCAAAHLDAKFADDAIEEYLVEPARALPPSLGVDTVAVLREAVAARARRRTRDAVLIIAMVVFVLFSFPLAIGWFLAALTVDVAGKRGGPRVRFVVAMLVALGGAVLLLMSGLGGAAVFTLVLYAMGLPAIPVLGALPVLLPVLIIVAVLTVDEFAVTELTRRDFRARNFVVDALALPPGRQRSLRTWGHATHAAALARVEAKEAQTRARGAATADVVVHRSPDPFVGAGAPLPSNLALPLVPDEDADGPPLPFTPSELHAHVGRVLSALRDSASLAPGGRLAELSIIDQVFLPAEQMLRESGTTLRPTVLPDPSRPPMDHLPLDMAQRLADEPQEAARYYRCYRVESWDRDLATSSYFTAGTDQRTLYVEWTHCVLPPIRAAFRAIDRHSVGGPGRRAFEAAIAFPLSVPQRLVGLFRRFRPLPYGPDEIEPGRYGAGSSLRELAAAPEPEMFFQQSDAIRYLTVVEQALLKAVEEFLKSRRYSVTDVLGVAQQKISNSITIQDGTFVDSSIGNGRIRHKTAAPAGAEPASKEHQ